MTLGQDEVGADVLARVPVFAGLDGDDLAWLRSRGTLERHAPGDVIAREGDPPSGFAVILEGRTEWRREVGGRDVHAVTLGAGEVFAELILLIDAPYPTTGRALDDVLLFVLPPDAFWAALARWPAVLRRVVRIAVERAELHETVAQQQARLTSLGTLAAGLAHQVNNPASAARSAAAALPGALDAAEEAAARLGPDGLADGRALLARATGAAPGEDPLERADREDALAERLFRAGAPEPETLAASLASAGLDAAEVAECGVDVLAWLGAALTVRDLTAEVADATVRIGDLVGAVRTYAYLDTDQGRGAVDVHAGLESALAVLAARTAAKGLRIERALAPAVPALHGSGADLNQVWTQLLANAIDAAPPGGRITLRTGVEPGDGGREFVSVGDDGPGVPPELRDRVFEPFFTTKDVGAGSGLGLDVVRRVVEDQHGGVVELESVPGDTRFVVRLPPGG